MPFQIVRNDITKMRVDAIVNAANTSLLGGGGVDGAIHRAAGPELLEECRTLGGCKTGDAKITSAYRLPAKYVIHTVGPRWNGGSRGEEQLLSSCYRRSLTLAAEANCESVAFPLISAGAYRYPKDQALHIAVSEIGSFLTDHDMTVYLVIFGRETLELGHKLSADLREYIDDRYVDAFHQKYPRNRRDLDEEGMSLSSSYDRVEALSMPMAEEEPKAKVSHKPFSSVFHKPAPAEKSGLDERVQQIDESFQQMLLRKIDESGMTDAQCYRKANIDRKLFSKIRSDKHYKPSKPTAIAFAVALELDLAETESMLKKAGYALSDSNKFDIIIRYFIEKGNYNVFEINEALFYYDQNLLGA